MLIISCRRWNQALAASFATFGGFGVIFALTWSATALPSLERTGQVGPLTSSDKSWIASLALLGALLVCPFTGSLINCLGRKWSIVAFSIVAIPGWSLLAWASTPLHLYAGRVLCGISAGGCSVAIPIYIREISSKDNRGMLGSLYFFVMCIGKVFSNAIGITYPANVASAICGLQPFIFVVLLLLIPESPTFLVKRGRIDKAVASLFWLQHEGVPSPFPCSRSGKESSESEQLAQIYAEAERIRTEQEDKPESSVSLKAFLTSGELLKPCLTAFLLLSMSQLCGVSFLTSYTVEIFEMIGDGVLEPGLATVILAIVQTIGCLPASLFVDKYGRRVLLLSSFAAMTLSLAAISGYFYIQRFQQSLLLAHHEIAYIPLLSIVAFYLAYCWGVGNIAFVTFSELLPPQIVGPASAAGNVLYWTSAFVSTQTFQMFKDNVPSFVWFAIYAVICFLGGSYTFFFLPETKGLTLEEIQNFYKSPRKNGEEDNAAA